MFKKKVSVAVSLIIPILGVSAAGMFLPSCNRFKSTGALILPLSVPGAKYVGMDTCIGCHKKQGREFPGAPHAAFAILDEGVDADGKEIHTGEGCESCHGPGSLHVAGDKSKILKGDWKVCVTCHMDVAAKFQRRYHHPVKEGRMSCTACHDPHTGRRPVFLTEARNKTCFECHPDKRGPWAFNHDAVTEDGCSACHDPHGSNIDKMLNASMPNLCLKCHYEAVNHPKIGRYTHGKSSQTPWYLLRGCNNCHRGIHGSNFSKSLRHE